jgi:hypothetical protein
LPVITPFFSFRLVDRAAHARLITGAMTINNVFVASREMKFCESLRQNTLHLFWFEFYCGNAAFLCILSAPGGTFELTDKINNYGFAEF